MTENVIPLRRPEVVILADAQSPADRVWMVARDAHVLSSHAVRMMRTLGYEAKSPSTRTNLSPIERAALVAVLDDCTPKRSVEDQIRDLLNPTGRK